MTNGRGLCFADLSVIVDQTEKLALESTPQVTNLNDASKLITELATITEVVYETEDSVDLLTLCG